MLNEYPEINEFKEKLDDGIWRVDWFGAIEKNYPVESEFAIQVVLSRLKINWKESDTATDQAVDHYTRRSISIGVGQLPYVHIGTFWEYGKRLPTIAGKIISFDLNINPETENIVITTSKVHEQTLISINDHSVSSNGKDSWCVHVAYGNDPAGIIIPVMEIIRFYYATSTLLSKALFDGDFEHDRNKLVNPEYTGMKGSRCVVHRRKNVEDNDCWTIGRILNDTKAYQGVLDITNSLRLAHANGQVPHPKSRFPFNGRTTLKARCKQIGRYQKRWLVLSLISCSGPFPYEELEVIADNAGDSANPETDIPPSEKKTAWNGIKTPISNGDVALQSAAEPEANSGKYNIALPAERFTVISEKEIIKTLKSECRYKAGELKTIVTPATVDMLGTGDGVYSETGVTPASLSVENKKRRGLPADFESLVAMLELLRSDRYPGASGKLHQFPSDDGLINVPLTKAANKRQWGYLESERKHRRRFMMADIVVNERHCCLIEVERRPASSTDCYLAEIIFHADWHAPSTAELIAVSEMLSKKNGRMKNVGMLPNGLLRLNEHLSHKLLHNWKSADEYATRVVHAIQATI